MNQNTLDKIIENNSDQYIQELVRYLRQPSLSVNGDGIEKMVEIVAESLQTRGFSVEIIPTNHWPVIFAERKGRSDRSIIFYNHYDVQPGDPLNLWVSPPFEPQIRDGRLFARGAMDDKGHLICRIAAIDALLALNDELPCTIKFLIEGEEEIGSPDLPTVVEQYKDRIHSDLCLWEFGDVDEDGYSIQYLGYRGMLNIELNIQTASSDGHSGIWGNLMPNAAWRLVWALASLKDSNEKVLVPGFYDHIIPPSESDINYLKQLPPMREKYITTAGSNTLVTGDLDNADLIIQSVMQPSCTICGLTSGYQGEGAKTIVPCNASAKVDFRLSPGQDAEDILAKVRRHLDHNGFTDISIKVLGKLSASRTPSDHPLVKLLSSSAEDVYGKPQRVLPICGGSGPAFLFDGIAETPVFTAGIGNPQSAIHSPNENIKIVDFVNGIRHTARICQLLEFFPK